VSLPDRASGDPCQLYDDLVWARDVHKVFDNGIETTVMALRRHLKEIGELPNVGATGDLLTNTSTLRGEASDLLRRDDFFTQIPSLQTVLKNLQVSVEEGSKALPAKVIYLTDGRSRRIRLGKMDIVLKQTSPRTMATAGRLSGLLIQALRYLGKTHVNEKTVNCLKRNLPSDARKELLADLPYAPTWIGNIMRRLARLDTGSARRQNAITWVLHNSRYHCPH
jgi:hypothetical protein